MAMVAYGIKQMDAMVLTLLDPEKEWLPSDAAKEIVLHASLTKAAQQQQFKLFPLLHGWGLDKGLVAGYPNCYTVWQATTFCPHTGGSWRKEQDACATSAQHSQQANITQYQLIILTLAESLSWMVCTMDTLHNDLKSNNWMVSRNKKHWVAMVTDFGEATKLITVAKEKGSRVRGGVCSRLCRKPCVDVGLRLCCREAKTSLDGP